MLILSIFGYMFDKDRNWAVFSFEGHKKCISPVLSCTGCGLLGHHERCECHRFLKVRVCRLGELYKFQNNERSQLLNLQVYLNLKYTSSVALWGLKLLTRWCTFKVWYCSHYCSLGRREDLGPAVGLSEGYQTQTVLPSILQECCEKIWDELGVLISWDPWLHSNIIIFSPETKGFSLHCKLDSNFSWLLRWTISKGRERSRPSVLAELEDKSMRIPFLTSHLLMIKTLPIFFIS